MLATHPDKNAGMHKVCKSMNEELRMVEHAHKTFMKMENPVGSLMI